MAQPDRHWYAGGGYLTARPTWTSEPEETYVLSDDELEKLLANMRERLAGSVAVTNAGDD